MKLLMVEDNAAMRRLLHTLLADLAETIIECTDGDEVVTAYESARFTAADRVLMDLDMPRVNGLDATRQLLAACPAARIIIVTQDDSAHSRQAALAAGACGYVLKDNLLELRQRLQTADLKPNETPDDFGDGKADLDSNIAAITNPAGTMP